MRESTACGQGYCAPSVEIFGLSRYMTEGGSDGFMVKVDNLDRTLRYKVILSVNSSANFNSICSLTPAGFTVPARRHMYEKPFTLRACQAGKRHGEGVAGA